MRRREVVLILAFWTFLAGLSTANRLLDARSAGPQLIPPSAPILLTFFAAYLWAALTPLVFHLAARLGLGRTGWLWRLPLLLGIGIGLSVLVHLAVGVVRMEVLEVPHRQALAAGLLPGLRGLWFLIDFIIFLGVLAAGVAREYFRRYQARTQEAVRLQAEAASLRAQLAEARLGTLRMQLNPHFLFNTLHAISALVDRDPSGARRMIARLSELLRSTLEEGEEAERTVARELEFTKRYLEIMRLRFDGRLQIETAMDPAAGEALVPALILQPLAENAVKHGVAHQRGRARIEVRAERRGDRLLLSVRDTGPGLPKGRSEPEAGIGLRNTAARLRQIYGDDQRLAVRSAEGGGTVAEIEIPYRSAPVPEERPVEAAPVLHG